MSTDANESNESYSSSDEEDDENAQLERASEGASELEILVARASQCTNDVCTFSPCTCTILPRKETRVG